MFQLLRADPRSQQRIISALMRSAAQVVTPLTCVDSCVDKAMMLDFLSLTSNNNLQKYNHLESVTKYTSDRLSCLQVAVADGGQSLFEPINSSLFQA